MGGCGSHTRPGVPATRPISQLHSLAPAICGKEEDLHQASTPMRARGPAGVSCGFCSSDESAVHVCCVARGSSSGRESDDARAFSPLHYFNVNCRSPHSTLHRKSHFSSESDTGIADTGVNVNCRSPHSALHRKSHFSSESDTGIADTGVNANCRSPHSALHRKIYFSSGVRHGSRGLPTRGL